MPNSTEKGAVPGGGSIRFHFVARPSWPCLGSAGGDARATNQTGHYRESEAEPCASSRQTGICFIRTAGGSLSRVQLLAEVILQAHLFDQVELGFEEIDVVFLVFKESLEEIG